MRSDGSHGVTQALKARILHMSESDEIAGNVAGDRAVRNGQPTRIDPIRICPARIYQFPSRRSRVRINDDQAEAQDMRLFLRLEIAAAVLACGVWLAWHLTHLATTH
jgi:hypothetical protein